MTPMNCTEDGDVTIGLASDGIIIRGPTSGETEAEGYVIPYAGLYTDRTNRRVRPVPLSRLWLIWFGSLPLLAAIVYLLVRVFGA
jgi:hypothetical protein